MTKPIILKFPFRLISKDNEKIYNRAGRFFLSPKFKEFENKIRMYAKKQYKKEPLQGDLTVELAVAYHNKRHCDASNAPKSCFDALQGLLYNNDNQIKHLIVDIWEGKEYNEHFVITVNLTPVT